MASSVGLLQLVLYVLHSVRNTAAKNVLYSAFVHLTYCRSIVRLYLQANSVLLAMSSHYLPQINVLYSANDGTVQVAPLNILSYNVAMTFVNEPTLLRRP